MSNQLTITRFGILVSSSRVAQQLSGNELLTAFRQQAEIFALYLRDERSERTGPIEIVGLPRDSVEEEEFEEHEEGDRFETLIASLPTKESTVSISGVEWIISEKASITSCSLQNRRGHGQVWLSIEGIPCLGKRKSGESTNASAFLDYINDREGTTLELAKRAYGRSLDAVSGATVSRHQFTGPIKISLTDDDTRPVARLVDAVYFDSLPPARLREVGDEQLQVGLNTLEDFVIHAAPSDLTYDTTNLTVESAAPDIKGIVCKCESSSRYASFLAGLARRAGDGGGYQDALDDLDADAPLSLDYVRARSPSRRLSARLAETEARLLHQGRPRGLDL
jgi:hypothetical protein